MINHYVKFLRDAANELRQLAQRAPDISAELRRLARDLDCLAEEHSADGANPEAA